MFKYKHPSVSDAPVGNCSESAACAPYSWKWYRPHTRSWGRLYSYEYDGGNYAKYWQGCDPNSEEARIEGLFQGEYQILETIEKKGWISRTAIFILKFNFSFYLKKVWTKSFRYKFHEKLNVVWRALRIVQNRQRKEIETS